MCGDDTRDAGWVLHPGDWPPRGSKVQRVGVLVTDGALWLAGTDDAGIELAYGAIPDGGVPLDAARVVAAALGHRDLGWRLPACVLARPEEAREREPAPATLVVVGRTDRLSHGVHWPEGASVAPRGEEPLPAGIASELRSAAVETARSAPTGAIVTECRDHVLSTPSFFHCTLVRRAAGEALLEYVTRRGGRIKDLDVPAGSRTHAFYREGADWVPWRITAPGGALLCELVHLAGGIRVGEDRVRYRDLLLDVLRVPGGEPRVIDQEDLARAEAEGLLSRAEGDRIRAAGERVAADFAAVLAGTLPG